MRPTTIVMMLGLVFSRLGYAEETHSPKSQNVDIPVMTSVISLDGDNWLLVVDPNNVGRQEDWQKAPREDAKQTKVPWIIQDAFPGYHGVAWYWREFTPPDSRHVQGRYLLRFLAVDYKADVWLNGVRIGEHEGGESPFVLDATIAIKPQQPNLLAVRVLNPTHQPIDGIVLNETPHRNKALPYTSGSAWDQGGIMDSVELLVVPAVRFDDFFVRPDWKTGVIAGVAFGAAVKNPKMTEGTDQSEGWTQQWFPPVKLSHPALKENHLFIHDGKALYCYRLKLALIPIVINICAYLIKSEIRISKSETSTNDQNSNDKSCVSRLSSIVLRGYGGRIL